jgi:hypothetical protein
MSSPLSWWPVDGAEDDRGASENGSRTTAAIGAPTKRVVNQEAQDAAEWPAQAGEHYEISPAHAYGPAEIHLPRAVIGITWPVPEELDDAALERKLFAPAG